MTEFGYKDTELRDYRLKNDKKFNILEILSNFVNYNYITEWQAGYIVGMINCQDDGPVCVAQERIFKQLILFVHSQIEKED